LGEREGGLNRARVVSILVFAFTVSFIARFASADVFEKDMTEKVQTVSDSLGSNDLDELPDTVLFSSSHFVITHEQLMNYNVHTILDILRLIPGVDFWTKGPEGSELGVSVLGRSGRGVKILVDGHPACDPYTMTPLIDFIPISRVDYVDVDYTNSPLYSNESSSNGTVNIVTYKGGNAGPTTNLNFTYGGGNRRARRAWFSTPDSYLNFTIAYDEYLHDAVESYIPVPSRKLGDYDMRSVLFDLLIRPRADESLLVRFHRFDRSYVGTPYYYDENRSRSGFGSRLVYNTKNLEVSLEEGKLESSGKFGKVSSVVVSSSARYRGRISRLDLVSFVRGDRFLFENVLWGTEFSPSFYRFEGGVGASSRLTELTGVRASLLAGSHSVVGAYLGGDVGVERRFPNAIEVNLSASRRVRLPSAEELFQPELSRRSDGEWRATSGNPALNYERSNELLLGVRIHRSITLNMFARDLNSVIVLPDSNNSVYTSVYGGTVEGAAASINEAFSLFGKRFYFSTRPEVFLSRGDHAPGIPSYHVFSVLGTEIRVFKNTETLRAELDFDVTGSRSFGDVELPGYLTLDFSSSLTILSSARVSFQLNNILNERYEGFPGFLMPKRYFTIGLFWELFD